jgi:hypothetical protein
VFHLFANWAEPLTRVLLPLDPRSLCPLPSTEFVETLPPTPKKLLGTPLFQIIHTLPHKSGLNTFKNSVSFKYFLCYLIHTHTFSQHSQSINSLISIFINYGSYILCTTVLYIPVCFQLYAQSIWMLLHVSAVKCSHLLGATNVEDTYSMLHRLSNINGNMFIHIRGIHKCTVY